MTADDKPATEVDVVEAMAKACEPRTMADGWEWPLGKAITALAAARSLGCLLPEEAAALRHSYNTLFEDCLAEAARHYATRTQRDALAARLKVVEEALRRIAGEHGPYAHTWPENGEGYSSWAVMEARAALTPAGAGAAS